jgi:hypothetical protein
LIVAKIIDGHAAWQAVWTAVVAGVGVTIVFSLAVLGATRSTDMRRNDRPAQAGLFALLALLGLAATIGAVVYAITLITTK